MAKRKVRKTANGARATRATAEPGLSSNGATKSASSRLAWKLVLRRLPAMVWTTDMALKVTSAGGSAFGELGLSAEALVGRDVPEYFGVHDDTRQPVVAHLRALQGEPSETDYVWQRKVYRLYVEPLWTAGGTIDGCVGMAIDVTPRKQTKELLKSAVEESTPDSDPLGSVLRRLETDVEERRQAEHRLLESEQRLLQMAAHVESVFWIYDLHRQQILYLSPGYEAIWGISPSEVTARSEQPILYGLHPDDRLRLHTADGLQRQGRPTVDEFRIVRPDGGLRWIRARVFPIHGSGGAVQRIAGIAEDLTHRKQEELAQRRSERLATLGNFAAGIAHEVNNPLGAALAATQAAMDLLPAEMPPLVQECLQTTLVSVRRCSEVVKSLLHFCRDEPAQRSQFDLRDVIQFAESITRSYAAERGCRIEAPPGERPMPMTGSPIELEIVLVNLFRNAVEAGAKRVALEVVLHRDSVELRVADNGRGLPEGHEWRVCEPFFTTRRERGGTGLGLSIVHGIVQQHGGVLDFQRPAEGGTVVVVRLPASSMA